MSADLVIADLLAEQGFDSPDAQRLALEVLVAAGLTNGKKRRIAAAKLDAVTAVLAERFAPTCARAGCRAASAATGKTIVDVAAPIHCSVCGGSANQHAIDRAIAELRRRGWSKLVVVGGSPGTRQALRAAVRDRIELRLISGTERRTSNDAGADLAWADVVVIWASTELPHKVSKLYTDPNLDHVITCSVRGIEGLAEAVVKATAARG